MLACVDFGADSLGTKIGLKIMHKIGCFVIAVQAGRRQHFLRSIEQGPAKSLRIVGLKKPEPDGNIAKALSVTAKIARQFLRFKREFEESIIYLKNAICA